MSWWTKRNKLSDEKKNSYRLEKQKVEIERVRLLEKKLMDDALDTGFILKSESKLSSLIESNVNSLDESEFKNLIAHTRVDRSNTGERIKGLGSGMSKRHDVNKKSKDKSISNNDIKAAPAVREIKSEFSNEYLSEANSRSKERIRERRGRKRDYDTEEKLRRLMKEVKKKRY